MKRLASDPDELAQAIPTTGIQDVLLTSLLQDLIIAEQKLVSLNKEYGPANSEVVKVSAQVEIQAGPHRVVSLMTREAADELGLAPGVLAVAAVKATSVVIEIPAE